MKPSESHLDQAFAALADPTRRAILARLARGEASVMELAEPFSISQPAISKHLKVLEHAGLISRGRDAQRRPCRLEAERLHDVADWVAQYRAFWEESFNRLDDYLHALQGRAPRSDEASEANRTAEAAHSPSKRSPSKRSPSKRSPSKKEGPHGRRTKH